MSFPQSRRIPVVLSIAAVLCVAAAAAAQTSPPAAAQAPGAEEPDRTLTLKIGDPALKGLTLEIRPGAVYDLRRGAAVSFDAMAAGLAAKRIVYVGETHTSMPMHDLQSEIVRALYARDPRLAVGLEMLPSSAEEALAAWSLGLVTRDEFLERSDWYVHWSYNFGYYAKTLDLAREHRLPVYGLNMPREVVTKIRMSGWDSLTPAEKAFIPAPPDLSNADHRALIRAVFESSGIPPEMKGPGLEMMFEGLYRAQSAWDEVMGANAVRSVGREGRRLVVLAGSGHLLYGLGLNRRAFEKSRLPGATVIAVEVPRGAAGVRVSRSLADYVVGIAPEDREAFPTIGLALKTVEGCAEPFLESKPRDGAAAKAGFEKGDLVLSAGGRAFRDVNGLRMFLAGFGWGAEIPFKVLRQGQVKDVALKLDPPPATAAPNPPAK